MVEKTKTWISWEQNLTFLQNEKILNLYLRWHISRSYHFVAEVTFWLERPSMEKLKFTHLKGVFRILQFLEILKVYDFVFMKINLML